MAAVVIQPGGNIVVIVLNNDSLHCVGLGAGFAVSLIDIAVFVIQTLVVLTDYNFVERALTREYYFLYQRLILAVSSAGKVVA